MPLCIGSYENKNLQEMQMTFSFHRPPKPSLLFMHQFSWILSSLSNKMRV